MKNKLLLGLLIVLSLFVVTGCGKKETSTTTDKDQKIVKVDGNEIRLKSEDNLKNFVYLQHAGDFKTNTMGYNRSLMVTSDDKVQLYVNIVTAEGKTLDEVVSKIDFATVSDKTVNKINYKYYEREGLSAEQLGDDCKGHFYLYEYEGDVYQIGIISNKDFSEFEKEFMGTAYFKKIV